MLVLHFDGSPRVINYNVYVVLVLLVVQYVGYGKGAMQYMLGETRVNAVAVLLVVLW